MKKRMKKLLCLMMTVSVIATSQVATIYAEDTTQITETSGTEVGDDVVISEDDKPYLALGADLSDSQKNTVLSLMGINASDLEDYDIVYVNNKEEHEYLDSYISSSAIGTRSLSSVVITQADKGAGLSISTYNINYCTIGMYKNALATAGITDANIIVAGPFELSGTCALVGILKAYEEMTGSELKMEIVDAAMDELVTTGELNDSIDAEPEDVEALIADLKQQLADGDFKTDADFEKLIKDTAQKYNISLSEEEVEKLQALLKKLKGLDLDWGSIADQASDWASKIGDKLSDEGFMDKIAAFFKAIIDAIMSIFS